MKTNKGIKIFYVVAAVLLLIFTFTDLRISQLLYNPESIFGWLFEAVGEVIMAIIGSFSSLYLLRTQKSNIGFKIGLVLAFIMNILTSTLLITLYFKFHIIVSIILALFTVLSMVFLTTLVPKHKMNITRNVSKVGLVLSLAPIFIVNFMKLLWGRERFRHMIDPVSEFTYWFMPQKLTTNNEFMSFPSGHAANSSTMIWITLLPLFVDKLKNSTKPLTIFAFIWMICVMSSRIIVGAHFASDVLIGSTITITLFYISKKYFIKE